ncbi:hypothetical protein K523DRAFT_11918 [Schizophyllum commune Tattone D]|nr:hypothetical protein K523DRAFT_11918 [Schizophyllum commune Tattone D]
MHAYEYLNVQCIFSRLDSTWYCATCSTCALCFTCRTLCPAGWVPYLLCGASSFVACFRGVCLSAGAFFVGRLFTFLFVISEHGERPSLTCHRQVHWLNETHSICGPSRQSQRMGGRTTVVWL